MTTITTEESRRMRNLHRATHKVTIVGLICFAFFVVTGIYVAASSDQLAGSSEASNAYLYLSFLEVLPTFVILVALLPTRELSRSLSPSSLRATFSPRRPGLQTTASDEPSVGAIGRFRRRRSTVANVIRRASMALGMRAPEPEASTARQSQADIVNVTSVAVEVQRT